VPAVMLLDQLERPERGVPGLWAPMVGRDQELSLLETLLERVAAEGRPDLVTIYGDPGLGKSRLTAEFLARADVTVPNATVVRGRCLPYGEGVTYWPLAEILKALAGVRDTDPPEIALERIKSVGRAELSQEVATSPEKATAALAYTVGLEDPAFSFRDLEPREVRRKIHAAWRSFFSALATRAPTIVVVEDIHWADAALLELLEELADRIVGPVLFVCPSRPELTERRPSWGGGRRNFSSIALEPLSEVESDRLVSLLLSVEELPPSMHRRILERAEGNPFFLEEIVRHLIDDGRIVRENDRWRARADIDNVVIPDTIQAVLAARIDLLAPSEKRALQGAAVVGRVFWPGPVRRLLDGEGTAVEETLARLEVRELVQSRLASSIAGEAEFIFKHVLTREVAYESLPRRERAGAHAAVAAWIESTAGERRGEFAELLAYHHEEAYRGGRDDTRAEPEAVERQRENAFSALMQASEDARRRFAVAKAAAMAERALALAREPLGRAMALEQVGMVALNDYRGDLACSSFREAADLRAEYAPMDRMAIARVCARAVEVPMRWPGSMMHVPPEEEVRRYLDLGIANVGDGDSEELVRLLLAGAFAAYAFGPRRAIADGEYERGRADAERAADMAMRLRRPDLASASLDAAGATLWPRGLYGASLSIIRRRLELAETLEDPWELGDVHAVAAWASALIGDYPEAVRRAERGEVISGGEAAGMTLHNLSWRAFARFSLGDWPTVVDEILPRVWGLLGDRKDDPPYFTAHAFGSAAFVHAARGDPAATELVTLLRRHAGAEGGEWPRLSLVWLAWILTRQGLAEEVWDLLGRLGLGHTELVRPLEDQVRAVALAEHDRWDEVPRFLERSRAFADKGGLRALPVHLDRLEGRTAVATGEPERGVELLRVSSAGFSNLQARWERACTDLWLADALLQVGRGDEARARLDEAIEVFEELRSLREIERSRELLAKLEG